MKVHEYNGEQRRSKQQFLKVGEVAQELNVGERSVWRLIEDPGNCTRTGSAIRRG